MVLPYQPAVGGVDPFCIKVPAERRFFCGMNIESRIIEVNTPTDQVTDIVPTVVHNGPETFGAMVRVASEFQLPTFEFDRQLEGLVIKTGEVRYRQIKDSSLPPEIKRAFKEPSGDNERLRTAAAYYQTIIKPIIATGSDVYRPTEDDILSFCGQIDSPSGVNFVLYYALSKTQSPKRTGSKDNVIDFAEIEMIKYYAMMGRVADRLGLGVSVTLVDETDILPEDDLLDINEAEREANRSIAQAAVEAFGAGSFVKIRSLREGVVKPLGADFVPLAVSKAQEKIGEVMTDLESDSPTALKIRMFTFLDCVPDAKLYEFGLTKEQIMSVRSMGKVDDLRQLPPSLLDFLVKHTAGFAAIMDLRQIAEGRVKAGERISEYPEYSDNKIGTGITRSPRRLSLKPHPIQYMKTTNPMHGLALYRNGGYSGVIEYERARSDFENNGSGKIVKIGRKPVFVLAN